MTDFWLVMSSRCQLEENIISQVMRLADDLKEIIDRMNAASMKYEATADLVFIFILRAPFLLTHTTNEKINYHVAENPTVIIQFSVCLYC